MPGKPFDWDELAQSLIKRLNALVLVGTAGLSEASPNSGSSSALVWLCSTQLTSVQKSSPHFSTDSSVQLR